MSISNNAELKAKILELKNHMLESMSEDSGVKKWHINQCINSIQRCLRRMDNCKTPKQALRNIARTIFTLNVLNRLASHDLIYTMEREDIADILNQAAVMKGLNSADEDLTEDFRTW